MRAAEARIERFLSNNLTVFSIPVYQRNYDWTIAQCKQLYKDILQAGSSKNNEPHFIGSIVNIGDGIYTASSVNELEIIDGQQRLTTITIIYIALYRKLKSLNKTIDSERIYNTYLINPFASDTEKLKLKATDNNNRVLRSLIENEFELQFAENNNRIISNYNYFKNEIANEDIDLVLKGLNNLVFVDISLERGRDNPQRIFESLNSTGLDLSQSDLIRNFVLMGLSREEQERIFKNYWELIEQNTKEIETNKSKTSDFIRDYLTLKFKEIPNKNEVYAHYKKKFPFVNILNLNDILKNIVSLSFYYSKLINIEKEEDKEIRNQLRNLSVLDVNVTYPFLMKVYEDYGLQVIDKDIFIKVLKLIESYVFRQFLVDIPNKGLNKVFSSLYDKVILSNYLRSIELSLLERSGSARFPKDSEVEISLKEKDVYNVKSKATSFLLQSLENHNNLEKIDFRENEITIEHIYPQRPVDGWKRYISSDEANLINEKYLHTIGNLTLSGNNAALGNQLFLDKRDMNIDNKEQGYKFSRLWLNRYLKDLTVWNLQEIQNRTIFLTKRVLEIWPRPEMDGNFSVDTFNEINIFEAEEPKSKKLDYAVFFNEKLNITNVSSLYTEILRKLFQIQPEYFFETNLSVKLSLSDSKSYSRLRSPVEISKGYYIESNMDSNSKFERIKLALKIFEFEDELLIKYSE